MSIPRYKFAIMLNGIYMYPWQIKVYEEIKKTGLADCELLIVKAEEPVSEKSILSKITNPSLLFEQFKKRKLNNCLYKPIEFEPLNSINQMQVQPEKNGINGAYFNESDIQEIKSRNLDFIIRFGFGILKGEILNAAKWGIWSFHHGDEQFFRGGPPGFWEIFKRNKQQGVILQRLTEKLDAGKIILKRQYSVVSDNYVKNVTKLMIESADMPAQVLQMISNSLISIEAIEPVKTTATIYRYPTNLQFLRFQFTIFRNKMKYKWIKIGKQENWIIGFRNKSDEDYKYIAHPVDGEYYADPFVFADNNKPYIVTEHYSYSTDRKSTRLNSSHIQKSRMPSSA